LRGRRDRLGCKRRAFGVSKHDGGELEDIRVLILPASEAHPRFGAGFFEKPLPVPSFFHRHLRQQDALVRGILHQQAMLADFDLAHVEHAPERREHRDFIFELWQFRSRYRRETRIPQSGECSRVAHRQV